MRFLTERLWVSALVLVVATLGCSGTSGDGLEEEPPPTDQIYADFSAEIDHDFATTRIEGVFKRDPDEPGVEPRTLDSSNAVDFDVGVRVAARLAGRRHRMVQDGLSAYDVELDHPTSGDRVEIRLERPTGASAQDSYAEFPRDFRIVSPNEGATFSRSNDSVTVEVDRVENGVRYEVWTGSSCLATAGRQVGRLGPDGRLVLDEGRFEERGEGDGSCSMPLGVTAVREGGTVDPAYRGGEFRTRRSRSVSIRTTP